MVSHYSFCILLENQVSLSHLQIFLNFIITFFRDFFWTFFFTFSHFRPLNGQNFQTKIHCHQTKIPDSSCYWNQRMNKDEYGNNVTLGTYHNKYPAILVVIVDSFFSTRLCPGGFGFLSSMVLDNVGNISCFQQFLFFWILVASWTDAGYSQFTALPKRKLPTAHKAPTCKHTKDKKGTPLSPQSVG